MNAHVRIYHTISGWSWDLFSHDSRLMTAERFIDGSSCVGSWHQAWFQAGQAWDHFMTSPDWQSRHHEETEQGL